MFTERNRHCNDCKINGSLFQRGNSLGSGMVMYPEEDARIRFVKASQLFYQKKIQGGFTDTDGHTAALQGGNPGQFVLSLADSFMGNFNMGKESFSLRSKGYAPV